MLSVYMGDLPKFLGVIIDEKLNWKSNIKQLVTRFKKVSCTVGSLFEMRRVINKNLRVSVYNALVNSQFTYNISVWGSTASKSKVNNLNPNAEAKATAHETLKATTRRYSRNRKRWPKQQLTGAEATTRYDWSYNTQRQKQPHAAAKATARNGWSSCTRLRLKQSHVAAKATTRVDRSNDMQNQKQPHVETKATHAAVGCALFSIFRAQLSAGRSSCEREYQFF